MVLALEEKDDGVRVRGLIEDTANADRSSSVIDPTTAFVDATIATVEIRATR